MNKHVLKLLGHCLAKKPSVDLLFYYNDYLSYLVEQRATKGILVQILSEMDCPEGCI